MKSNLAVFALLACLAVCWSDLAEAQIRTQQFDSGDQPNADHERAKTEADSAYRSRNYRRTIELTSNVLAENPRDDVAYYLRASARVEYGLQRRDNKIIRDGVADAREAIRLERANYMYYLPYLYGMTNLAQVENRKAHAEVAVKVASGALDVPNMEDGDRANLLYQRGNANRFLEQYEAATDDFREAIRLDGNHMGAHVALAETYAAADQPEEALAAFNATVERFPSNPLAYNNRGSFRQQQGDFSEAISDFTRAVELNSNYYFAYTNRGNALVESGDPQAALFDFSASLRINPKQPSVYNMRSAAKLKLGDMPGAISDQQEVVKMLPEFAPAHADLAHLQFFAENYRIAANEFRRALELDSSLRHLYPWQYWALKLSGQDTPANEALASAKRPDAEESDWIDRVVAFLEGTLSEDELLASVNQSDEEARAKQLCEAHFFLGLEQEQSGQTAEAQSHFRQALDTAAADLSAYKGAQFALKRVSSAESRTSGVE